VKMTGDITLPTERANLTFTVAPKLDETVALSAGLFTLNPLVGVAVYVGQKVIGNPFEKLFSFKYAVSGTWDNPEVERLSRGVGAQPGTPPGPQPVTKRDGLPVVNLTTPQALARGSAREAGNAVPFSNSPANAEIDRTP
jgi:hypothetical protein